MIFTHNTNRIEAFSDAVFAFAATLLMVSLNGESEISALTINWVNFIGFFVSFFVLILIWKTHYNFFRRTDYVDNWIISLNSILLFSVLFFVFPVKTLINSMFKQSGISKDDLSYLFELYGIGIFVIFLCLSLMYYRVYKKDKEAEGHADLLFYAKHFGIYVLVSFASIIMALAEVGLQYGIPGFAYFLLGPLCYWNSMKHFSKKEKKEEV